MRQVDCGILPVLRNGRPAGVVTDRDLCLALAERDCRPGELPVGDAMSRGLWACREDDEVQTALDTMRARRVRRLPVLDAAGDLRGILSMNDVLREAGAGLDGGLAPEEALRALQVIGEHRYPARKEDNVDVTALSRFV
jgi:predicted transcriptional regulator